MLTIHIACLSHLNILPEQQKNKVIVWCYFAGVDTKITGVGISVKLTGLVYLYCVVSANCTVKTNFTGNLHLY